MKPEIDPRINYEIRDLAKAPGGGTPGGARHHLNPKLGGQRGEPEAFSQPVDPGGVGGLYIHL